MKMGSKQVKTYALKVLFVLLDAKRCTCPTLEAKQENVLKTS